MKYTVVIEKSDNGYSEYLPDMPGCVAAGDTLTETADLIRKGIVPEDVGTLVEEFRAETGASRIGHKFKGDA